ncbi:uncharacterized protein LOC117643055 isoform X2 [Thrips palmi]|uniref:Uncharacterized protein LOC117643055 isoform X2 n=1 Tax=Thrips palmi TaxID=161013 RepID=A0A6P8YLC6_THRPL|nr:uncharacterized protein LOC117643055 isoform X2 [Thrips palmi]
MDGVLCWIFKPSEIDRIQPFFQRVKPQDCGELLRLWNECQNGWSPLLDLQAFRNRQDSAVLPKSEAPRLWRTVAALERVSKWMESFVGSSSLQK